MSKPLQIILALILLVAVAAGSFYAGTVVGKNQVSSARSASFARGQGAPFAEGSPPEGAPGGAFPRRFGGQGDGQGGGAFGQIEQIEGNVLTVTTAEGGQMQVTVTDTTLIEKNASVAVDDLELGETVIVSGSSNDDGSITARSIQVAPAGRLGGGLPAAPGGSQ